MCSHELKYALIIKEIDSVKACRMKIELDNDSNDCVEFENGTENAHPQRREIPGLFEFTSKVRRSFFACKGEGDAISSVIKSIQDNCVAGKEPGIKYVSKYLELRCQNCDTATNVQERMDMIKFSTRTVNLHTLHYGSVCIGIVDFKC